MDSESEIVNFFNQQTVFLTGATGFLGKLIIEKLLKCTDIKKIYILVREKKGIPVTSRLEEMFENIVFDKMKERNPNFKSIVQIVNGDCAHVNLGLSREDEEELILNVTCVLHCAATVRFDQHIKTATYINIRATRDFLKMAQQMQNLKAFVHVSTAYSHCPRTHIDEKFYDTYITGDKLIQFVDLLDDKLLEEITPNLLGDWPNTYVFTKAVAEQVIQTYSGSLPIAVVRPGQIFTTIKEPHVGWVDNVYGSIGVCVGTSLGILRVMCANKNCILDLIPADYVINTVLAVASDLDKQSINMSSNVKIAREPIIYHSVTGATNPLTIGGLTSNMMELVETHSPIKAIWWPMLLSCPNLYMHYFLAFFLHTIPGYLVDTILIISGKKPMLVNGYKKLNKHMEVVRYFSLKSWTILDHNTQNLWKRLNDSDKNLFQFDTNAINWPKYLNEAALGGRVYLMKDPLSTLPQAIKRAKVFKILHYSLITFFYLVALVVCFMLSKIIYTLVHKLIVSIIYYVN